jgi:hypothetical protein
MITSLQFIVAVSIWNTLWFVAWSRSTLLNIIVKVIFLLAAIAGWYFVFKA